MSLLALGLALALWPAAPAMGQLAISADVDKTQVALDDQVVLSVTVSGPQASLPDPQLPALQNFSVYSSGRNQSISFVNGRVSSSIAYTYVLVPRAVGKGLIPPISVSYQGASAQTNPIEIQVVRPGPAAQTQAPVPVAQAPQAQPQTPAQAKKGGAPDVFITTELDKRKAYVNEQVTLSVKFHTAVSLMGNPEYVPPKLEGFLTEDMPPMRHYNATAQGRNYYVTEIKTALFPLHAGKLSVGSAAVRCQVQQEFNMDPFATDFFQRFFSQGIAPSQTKTIASQPLALEVESLPTAGKPGDFSGAVGRFSLSAALDKNRAKAGDAVNLTLTVQGAGNLKAIGEPALPSLPSWRVFDPVTSVNQEKKADLVQGSKVIRIVLVPRVSGDLTIPPISMSYFDPGRKEYVRLQTKAFTVSVAPGDANAAAAVGYTAPSAAAAAKGITRINEDIAYLQVRPQTRAGTRFLEAVASAGPIHAIPFLFLSWTLGLFLYRERLASDPKGARFRGALKTAMARLHNAGRACGIGSSAGTGRTDFLTAGAADAQKAAGLMAEALSGFLADKLGEPASGLTMRGIADIIHARQPHLPERELERIRAVWEDLDSRRFAPTAAGSAADGRAVLAELKSLLKTLNQELKR